jgi:hypothetical protein
MKKKNKTARQLAAKANEWWAKDYAFNQDEFEMEDDYSPSRSWMGGLFGSFIESKDDNVRLRKALDRLARMANVLSNSNSEDEQALTLTFAHGTNAINENEVTLSNRKLLDTEEGSSEEDRVMDAMTGQVMLHSTLKKSSNIRNWNAFGESSAPCRLEARELWKAIETIIARKAVLKDWAGLTPYFQRHAEVYGGDKEELQWKLDNSDPSLDLCMKGIAWNLIHTGNKVSLPAVYARAVAAAANLLKDRMPVTKRYSKCEEIAEAVCKVLGEDIEQGHCSTPEGQNHAGEATDWEAAPDEPEKEAESPTDNELFGGEADNDIDRQDEDISVSTREPEEPDDTGDPSKGACGVNVESQGQSHFVTPTPEDRVEYRANARRLAPEIHHLRSMLQFYANERTESEFGHRMGILDPGSLHKLALGGDQNPRLFEQRNMIGKPGITFGVLMDESGSMSQRSRYGDGSSRAEYARDIMITLAEALDGMDGVQPCLMGYSSGYKNAHAMTPSGTTACKEQRQRHPEAWLYEYHSALNKGKEALVQPSYGGGTPEPQAAHYMAKYMHTHYDTAAKVLFVVSDGGPNHGGCPAGMSSAEFTRSIVKHASRNWGVEIYGIAIDNAYNEHHGCATFGEGRYIILKDVASSLHVLTNFLRQTAAKQTMKKSQ